MNSARLSSSKPGRSAPTLIPADKGTGLAAWFKPLVTFHIPHKRFQKKIGADLPQPPLVSWVISVFSFGSLTLAFT